MVWLDVTSRVFVDLDYYIYSVYIIKHIYVYPVDIFFDLVKKSVLITSPLWKITSQFWDHLQKDPENGETDL